MYGGEVHKSEGVRGASERWESGKEEGMGRERKRDERKEEGKFSTGIAGVSYSNSQCR